MKQSCLEIIIKDSLDYYFLNCKLGSVQGGLKCKNPTGLNIMLNALNTDNLKNIDSSTHPWNNAKLLDCIDVINNIKSINTWIGYIRGDHFKIYLKNHPNYGDYAYVPETINPNCYYTIISYEYKLLNRLIQKYGLNLDYIIKNLFSLNGCEDRYTRSEIYWYIDRNSDVLKKLLKNFYSIKEDPKELSPVTIF